MRLCFTEGLDQAIRYVTLSHCWGQVTPPRLMVHNLDTFAGGLCVEDLPKTFSDALTITLELGFKYLWIDSLCILQDSEEDWYYEAQRMGKIYRNSVCNVAALGASDCKGGCFTTRNPHGFRTCRILQTVTDSIYVTPVAMDTEKPPHDALTPHLAPLHTRAWFVQERAMSPRTLYYGPRSYSGNVWRVELPRFHLGSRNICQ